MEPLVHAAGDGECTVELCIRLGPHEIVDVHRYGQPVSPTVAAALPLFRTQTHDVERDPRFRLSVEDARFFLRRGGPWDVIVSEPSNLWVGHNDLLFTDAYFRTIASRLSPEGVLLQWLYLYETDDEVICSVVATLSSVFPELTAFRGTKGDWLIVASRGQAGGSESRARTRWPPADGVRASLAELGIAEFDDLWSRRVDGFDAYAVAAARDCPVHTTLDTRLGDRAVRAMFHGTTASELH